jgi:outer membrane immunogenic protein
MRTDKLKRLVFASAMFSPIILASATITSEAADAQRGPAYPYPAYPPPPPPVPYYIWTGVYAGVHAGGGWADLGFGDTGSGFIGGGQIGYNYQINQWVFGLE